MCGCVGASIKYTGTDKWLLSLHQITTTQEKQPHHTGYSLMECQTSHSWRRAHQRVVCLLSSFVMQTLVCSSHTCTAACRLVAMVTTIICPGIWVAGMFEVIHFCTCNNSIAVAA